jgi:serine/threonine protein kinase
MTNIVMEKGKNDLLHWINEVYYPLSDNTVKNIAFQVLQGLAVIHEMGVIHRDLKPSNLILREDHSVAICDFGSAVECTKGEEYEIEGFTRWYKCPEMLFGFRRYQF